MGPIPSACIVFEDAPLGIEAARRAGMRAVGVCTSYTAQRTGGAPCACAACRDYHDLMRPEFSGDTTMLHSPTDDLAGAGPARVIHRSDYSAPAFWIDTVDLCFDLDPAKTRVLDQMHDSAQPGCACAGPAAPRRRPQPRPGTGQRPGHLLQASTAARLVLENLPEGHAAFDAGNLHHLRAAKNTKLMGLYVEQRLLLHPVRGRGFPAHYLLPRPPGRRWPATPSRCAPTRRRSPVLLSNGNLVEHGAAGGPSRAGTLREWGRSVPKALLPVRPGSRAIWCAREQRITIARRAVSTCCRCMCARRPRQNRARP